MVLGTRRVEGSGTTPSVVVQGLRLLHDGHSYQRRLSGTGDCRLLCRDRAHLQECTAERNMAWVRHAIQSLRRHEIPPYLRPGYRGAHNDDPARPKTWRAIGGDGGFWRAYVRSSIASHSEL